MGDDRRSGTFGPTLRALREARGWTQAHLAREVGYSEAAIGHLEAGRRSPSGALAAVLDAALGTTPVLTLDSKGGLDMATRRALLGYAGIIGVTLGTFGMATFDADLVSAVSRLAHTDDAALDTLATTYERQYLTDRSPEFAARLMRELTALREIMRAESTTERYRTAARLTQTLALLTADRGDIPVAHSLAQQAIHLSVASHDQTLESYLRGRLAARGVYEGWSVSQARDAADRALALSPGPSLGALEAHAAMVHIAGLTNDYPGGMAAVNAMSAVAERLPAELDPNGIGPMRARMFRVYLTGRISPSLDEAERAYQDATMLLRGLPVWSAEIEIYYQMARVRAGYVTDAVPAVLDAVKASPAVHLLGVGVLDFTWEVDTSAPGYRSDELDELGMYVPAGTVGPWATLRP